jgi:Na+-transporting NADH:ubiquinone oxidoreductase subunit B
LQRYHALFEMVDTLFFSPPDLTRGAPHVRDAIDLKRVMILVVFAAAPCVLVGLWNTGFQANTAMAAMGIDSIAGWRGTALGMVFAGNNPSSVYDNFMLGLTYFLPIYIVTMAAGGFWEILFSGVRNHEINEGFFVTSLLFALILPATIPLWQVAVGISFGVVIGKEVFGGTGKNFLNPALVGRAFLYFAYPVQISGDAVWTPVDGFTGATALGVSAIEGMAGIADTGLTWMQAFLGQMQGSLGETSALACLIGGVMLVYTGVASWRIIVACFAGLIIPALLVGSGTGDNPMMAMPWHWHIVLGGFAFGAIFMATDPVSATQTEAGKWVYGLLIGFLTWVIRVINPAFPEGIMLAILFANIFAPVIDYFVVQANIRRRVRRSG